MLGNGCLYESQGAFGTRNRHERGRLASVGVLAGAGLGDVAPYSIEMDDRARRRESAWDESVRDYSPEVAAYDVEPRRYVASAWAISHV